MMLLHLAGLFGLKGVPKIDICLLNVILVLSIHAHYKNNFHTVTITEEGASSNEHAEDIDY